MHKSKVIRIHQSTSINNSIYNLSNRSKVKYYIILQKFEAFFLKNMAYKRGHLATTYITASYNRTVVADSSIACKPGQFHLEAKA